MRKLVSGMMALWLFSAAGAQDFGLVAGFGMATSTMDDMKYYQEYILGTYPVEGKVVTSFPAYATLSISAVKQLLPVVQIGAGYAYTTTGGRTNYTDYSGSISTDILASSHRLGAWVSYSVLNGERYSLSVFGRVDANITRINVSTSRYALGYSDGWSYELGSVSPAGTAGLEFFLHFNDFSIGVDGGYMVDIPGNLSNRDDDEEFSDPADPQRILTSDWSGWRVQLKGMIWFGN